MAQHELVNVIEQFLYKLRETDRDIFIRRYWYLDPIKDIAKRHKEELRKTKNYISKITSGSRS